MKILSISASHVDETGKYWADSQVRHKQIFWHDDETIHEAITRAICEHDYCEFSYQGKPQGDIYQDTKDGDSFQTGYWYRTKHTVENRSDNVYKENVPFTTWVTIHGEVSPVQRLQLESVEK